MVGYTLVRGCLVKEASRASRGRFPGGALTCLSLRGCEKVRGEIPQKWKERQEQNLG